MQMSRCRSVVLARRPREFGSVAVTAVAVVALVTVLTTFVVRLGVAANDRAKAQAAADAVALAAAAAGRSAADALAARNGVRITGYSEVADDVVVSVEFLGATATATGRHSALLPRYEDLTDTSTTSAEETDPSGELIVDGIIILRPTTSKPR